MNSTRQDRVDTANAMLRIISEHGRQFFAHEGRVSRFVLDRRDRVWFVNKWTDRLIWTHQNGSWGRDFSEGGTLRELCVALREFIMGRAPLPLNHLGSWPLSASGDLWDYGKDEMARVRERCAALVEGPTLDLATPLFQTEKTIEIRPYAEISECGTYRYLLERCWGPPLLKSNILIVCMLNPSTADAETDDATIRWLIGWARKHGYDGIRVVNMAAYRATSPRDMLAANDPHGPENTCYLRRYTAGKTVLCAWGANAGRLPRYDDMLTAMSDAKLCCLATNKDGSPGHPLRRSHQLTLQPWAA